LINFISASDPQLDIPTGGDSQTTIRGLGDLQLFITGSVANDTITPPITPIIPPSPSPSPSPGGGPSGTGAAFTLDPETLQAFLTQGEIVTETVTIKNIGGQAITVNITNGRLEDLVRLSDDSVQLSPGESKSITIDLIAREDTIPDLYMGLITFQSGSTIQYLYIALEIETKNPLLDVAVNIPFQYQEVSPGEVLLAQFTLYNLGSTFGDVFLTYTIRDDNGNTILNQTDSIAIQTQASFVKNFQIPTDAQLGHYLLYVRADYAGKIASASTGFQIVSVSTREKVYIIIIIISLVIIISGFIGFMIIRRINKHYKPIKRVDTEDLLWR